MKRIFCHIVQLKDNISLHIYTLNINKSGLLKKNTNYDIIKEITLSFPYQKNITTDALKNYGNIIKEKLTEEKYNDAPIDLAFDIEGVFESSFNLPKLSGKALTTSYNNEMNKQFGNLTKNFIILKTKTINETKGYTYNFLFIEETNYNKILSIFTYPKLKLEKSIYIKDLFANITKKEGIKNIGILMDENETNIFITNKNQLTDSRKIPLGYNHINNDIIEKFNIKKSDVTRFREENISKIALKKVIYHSMRKIIEEVYLLLLKDTNNITEKYNNIIDKTYIYSLDGRTEELLLGLPINLKKQFDVYKLKTSFHYHVYIDSIYCYQKNYRQCPIKVHYENK